MRRCAWDDSAPGASALGQDPPAGHEGRRLADALQALQASGLRIVFSTAVVTSGLRVVAEPRARAAAREILDELLAPHGLEAMQGPGSVIMVVRAKPADSAAARKPHHTRTAAIRGQVIDATTHAPCAASICVWSAPRRPLAPAKMADFTCPMYR